MKTLEQEAEEYEDSFGEGAVGTESIDFIAGVNSKVVQIEKIKAQINENNSIIELVKLHSECKNERLLFVLNDRINKLQQQLKKLET